MKQKILIFAFILTIVVVCISGCDFATPETGVLYLKNSTPEALNVVVNAKNLFESITIKIIAIICVTVFILPQMFAATTFPPSFASTIL